MRCSHDDVARWDGEPWGEEQRLDEADGHRPEGAKASRCHAHYRQDPQPVSIQPNLHSMQNLT